jgi:hypothetical protein
MEPPFEESTGNVGGLWGVAGVATENILLRHSVSAEAVKSQVAPLFAINDAPSLHLHLHISI